MVAEYSTDNVSPRVGLIYQPFEDRSIYASYSESFEPDAPVSGAYANANEILDRSRRKVPFFDGSVLATAAVFDLRRRHAPQEDTGTNMLVQRAEQRSYGFEVGLTPCWRSSSRCMRSAR